MSRALFLALLLTAPPARAQMYLLDSGGAYRPVGGPNGLAQLDSNGGLGTITVTPTGATAKRTTSDRASDARYLRDFLNPDGSAVDPTGLKDAAPALSACIAASPSGTCHPGSGTFLINSAVTCPAQGIDLEGDGWNETTPGAGTWFKIITPSLPSPFTCSMSKLTVRHVAFEEAQPGVGTTFTPAAYDYVITGGGDMVMAEDLLFFGITKGIRLTYSGAAGSGRHQLTNLYGQTFGPMVFAEAVTDTMRIEGIHHWPYWSFAPSNAYTVAQQAAVFDYQVQNTDVVLSERNDNSVISHVFGYGVRTPVHFDTLTAGAAANQGPSSLASLCDIHADASKYRILITAFNTTVSEACLGYNQGYNPGYNAGGRPSVIPGSAGIYIDDPALDGLGTGIGSIILDSVGSRSFFTDLGGLNARGTANVLRLVNPMVTGWDASQKGTYALYGQAGVNSNILLVTNPSYVPGTNGLTGATLGNANYTDGWAKFPAGNAVLPGVQVGDTQGTGLAGNGGQLSASVNGGSVLRMVNPTPASNNTDLLVASGTGVNGTGTLTMQVETTDPNGHIELVPKGTGAVVVNGPVVGTSTASFTGAFLSALPTCAAGNQSGQLCKGGTGGVPVLVQP